MKPGVALACLVGGAATGLAAVLVHGHWWGLPVALAATVATLVALPGGWWLRLPYGAGWAIVVGLATPERPEGDYLIAADARGYVLLGATVVVLMASMVGIRDHSDNSDATAPDT